MQHRPSDVVPLAAGEFMAYTKQKLIKSVVSPPNVPQNGRVGYDGKKFAEVV